MLPRRALLSSQDVRLVAAFNHTTILYVGEREVVVCNSMLLVQQEEISSFEGRETETWQACENPTYEWLRCNVSKLFIVKV